MSNQPVTTADPASASSAPASDGDVLLRVDERGQVLPGRSQSLFQRQTGLRPRGRGRQPGGAPRRDPGPGRRDRLRQVHPGPLHHAAVRHHLRHDHLRRRGHQHAVPSKDAPVPPGDADDLPGPVRLAEPAPPGRVDHRRPVRDPRHRRRRGPQEAGPGGHGAGRAQPGALQPVPGRVLRRPAPAHRRGPGPGLPAQAGRSATSPCPRWTCRSRPRSSTCWPTCRRSSA